MSGYEFASHSSDCDSFDSYKGSPQPYLYKAFEHHPDNDHEGNHLDKPGPHRYERGRHSSKPRDAGDHYGTAHSRLRYSDHDWDNRGDDELKHHQNDDWEQRRYRDRAKELDDRSRELHGRKEYLDAEWVRLFEESLRHEHKIEALEEIRQEIRDCVKEAGAANRKNAMDEEERRRMFEEAKAGSDQRGRNTRKPKATATRVRFDPSSTNRMQTGYEATFDENAAARTSSSSSDSEVKEGSDIPDPVRRASNSLPYRGKKSYEAPAVDFVGNARDTDVSPSSSSFNRMDEDGHVEGLGAYDYRSTDKGSSQSRSQDWQGFFRYERSRQVTCERASEVYGHDHDSGRERSHAFGDRKNHAQEPSHSQHSARYTQSYPQHPLLPRRQQSDSHKDRSRRKGEQHGKGYTACYMETPDNGSSYAPLHSHRHPTDRHGHGSKRHSEEHGRKHSARRSEPSGSGADFESRVHGRPPSRHHETHQRGLQRDALPNNHRSDPFEGHLMPDAPVHKPSRGHHRESHRQRSQHEESQDYRHSEYHYNPTMSETPVHRPSRSHHEGSSRRRPQPEAPPDNGTHGGRHPRSRWSARAKRELKKAFERMLDYL